MNRSWRYKASSGQHSFTHHLVIAVPASNILTSVHHSFLFKGKLSVHSSGYIHSIPFGHKSVTPCLSTSQEMKKFQHWGQKSFTHLKAYHAEELYFIYFSMSHQKWTLSMRKLIAIKSPLVRFTSMQVSLLAKKDRCTAIAKNLCLDSMKDSREFMW